MLLNAWKMWNMSVPKVEGRKKVTRHQFLQCVAHELLHYETEMLVSPAKVQRPAPRTENNHQDKDNRNQPIHEIVDTKRNTRCLVCRLEWAQIRRLQQKIKTKGKEDEAKEIIRGHRKKLSLCRSCGVVAHNHIVQKDPKFVHTYFPGKPAWRFSIWTWVR